MKKYFLGLIAFVAILTCVFAFKTVHHTNNKKSPSLYWFVGQTYTGRQDTHVNEVPLSGCPDAGLVHCEDGYDDNDFKTIGDPTSGLNSSATIDDFIRKQ